MALTQTFHEGNKIFYDCLWCGIQLLANFIFLIVACLLFGFTNVLVIDHGQTHPLVVPLGMLNLKIIRSIQLQDNLGLILKRLFISKFIS